VRIGRVSRWLYRLSRDAAVWREVRLHGIDAAADVHVALLAHRVPLVRALDIAGVSRPRTIRTVVLTVTQHVRISPPPH
jgi:hypothetical protein